MKRWGLVAALAVVVGLAWALVPAEPPALGVLAIANMPDRVVLGRSVSVLEDDSARATLDDVRRAPLAARFARHERGEIAQGFGGSAVWIRLHVANTSNVSTRWLLEVDEPTLDDVRLFVVHADGRREEHRTGDTSPFASRDVRSASFVFDVTTPALESQALYLRVVSGGPRRVPLAAFRPAAWEAAHERDDIGAWLFYGIMIAIAMYYVSVFFTVWQTEHLWCTESAVAMMLVQATVDGHVAQHLLPTRPDLVDRALPVTIALSLFGIAAFALGALRRLALPKKIDQAAHAAVLASLVVLAFAALAPPYIALRAMGIVVVLVCAAGPLLIRVIDARRFPELKLLKVCFLALMIATPVGIVRFCGYLPPHPLLDLSLRLGFLAYGGVMSLGLASWVKWMRERLSTMNSELSDNVSNLQIALARAEEASERAERATMAKDDFVATMSHELRTPLNAIINIPQGMISDFDTVRSARCGKCAADFLLDEGEQVGPDTVCEECNSKGTLVAGTKVLFNGDPARCLHFLKKIERSGHHLLQMVNGVLDYSKMEAGRFQLTLEPADLEALCREVVDQMSDLGSARNVQIVFTRLTETPDMTFDALRIKQVLINLLSNAVKFSEPNSVVGVELSRDGDAAIVEVQDAGIGIAKENQERIFAGFEQVHKGDTRKYGGTGLGLSISRSLVRMHGGELSVRSEIGQGST
ncbi:MAG: 7TM-DISM domain-containing protein, partial [Polyangiales bacterium]